MKRLDSEVTITKINDNLLHLRIGDRFYFIDPKKKKVLYTNTNKQIRKKIRQWIDNNINDELIIIEDGIVEEDLNNI